MGKQQDVHTLAAAYQRIPAESLRDITHLTPLNYAVLLPKDVPVESITRPRSAIVPLRHPREELNSAVWQTKRFAKTATLQTALLEIELLNSAAKMLFKVQLNFTNGNHVLFTRSKPTVPASLECGPVYSPNAVFSKETAARTQTRRSEKGGKLNFLVDDQGRSLKPNPSRPNSFSPEALWKDAPPPPPPAQTGFTFQPVSMNSFQVRPSDTITGCRPGIRDTNPYALNFRPRPLAKAATPNTFEHVDERNRRVGLARKPGLNGTLGDGAMPLASLPSRYSAAPMSASRRRPTSADARPAGRARYTPPALMPLGASEGAAADGSAAMVSPSSGAGDMPPSRGTPGMEL